MRLQFRVLLLPLILAVGIDAAVTSVTVSPSTTTLIHGQSVQLTATVNGTGASPAVIWSFSPTLGTLSSTGLYTAPASVFQNFTITVTATSLSDPSKFGSATIFLVPTVSISVNPTSVTLSDGQSQQFVATVMGTANTDVTWSISPDTAGFITAGGLYTAPATISGKQTVTVTVVSVADPTKIATATVTLSPTPAPAGITVTPANVTLRAGQLQQFNASVTGLANTLVTWSISPVIGTISATGLYTAPNPINTTQTVTVTATSVGDPTKSASANITLAPYALTITPENVTLKVSGTQQFTVTANNLPFTDVTWSLSSDLGTITQAGLYTAPAFASIRLVIQVIATSNADPTRSAVATVTITQSGLTVTPSTVSLTSSQTQSFSLNIDGVPEPDPTHNVQWSLSPVLGTISPTGVYTAPATISTATSVTLTATYQGDPTKTAKATISLVVFVDVGHGAPNLAIQQQFISAFYRNGFNYLVSLPPVGDVRRLGSTGWVQEFPDINRPSARYALVKPDSSTSLPTNPTVQSVYQMSPDVYAYYTSVGVGTAGYPTMDTANCPAFDAVNSCTYSFFDRNYALFVYKLPVFATQTNFTIRNAFYTRWTALGGLSGPGRPTDIELAVTGASGTTATQQTYSNGAIFTITNGSNNGKTFGVIGATYRQYVIQGGPSGLLGLPTGDEVVLATGDRRQTFQGGSIQGSLNSDPVLRLPVASVLLSGFSGNPLKLTVGNTLTLTAKAYSATGIELPGRAFTWSTSNGQVATIQSGQGATSAVVEAKGGGLAVIRATSEGIASTGLSLSITAPCCQIGEGSPTPIIQLAFQNAVTRNRLSVQLPVQNPVQRSGTGYLQQVQSTADGSTILLAKSDRAPAAYPVSGDLLARYQQLGGTTGSLGYPTADPTSGATQLFENSAALAGKPVRLVAGAILTKWAALGYETGAAGPPAGESSVFRSSIGANAGVQQAFRGGVIFAATSGPRSRQAYLVGGLILDRYLALGGAGGAFGMAVSDEFASAGVRRQDFEGGYIDYGIGDAAAREHAVEQRPAVTVTPGSALAGSRVRLTVSGFQPNASIRVSITGQPAFVVTAANGAYSWEIYIPLNARAATVTIHAEDTKSADTADATYNIVSLATSRAQLIKTQGDLQTGLPGAILPQTLRVVLRDQSGNGLIGAPVAFQASPGAQVVQASPVTDDNGQAEAVVRLAPAEGVALILADSPGIASSGVTFSVMATASTLPGFPRQAQPASQKSALAAAVSSILRYHQNRGELPAPNGLADPAALSQYLRALCVADAQGKQICDGLVANPDAGEQVVNLWRAGGFAGGGVDVEVEKADAAAVRDLVGQGSPVLLALSLTANGQPAGGHYIVAIGVGAGSELLIQDPSPNFAQTRLDDYLNGFTAGAYQWKAELKSAVRLALRAPLATRFVLATISQPAALLQDLVMDVKSITGGCGQPLDLPDAADFSAGPAAAVLISRFVACDGASAVYQASVGAARPYRITLTDFASGGGVTDLSGSAPAAFRLTRPSAALVVAPQDLTVLPNGIGNTATFTAGLAPGGMFSVLGAGLMGPGVDTVVTINGVTASIVSATPFQIIAEVPPSLDPGTYTLRIQSAFGAVEQTVEIVAHAPAIFILPDGKAAVVNPDGKTNSATTPLSRGQTWVVYCTGLGTVTQRGNQSLVVDPVTAVLADTEIPVSFAGLTAGFVALYQVSVPVPSVTPPGIDLPLTLRQAGVSSNTVPVSIQ